MAGWLSLKVIPKDLAQKLEVLMCLDCLDVIWLKSVELINFDTALWAHKGGPQEPSGAILLTNAPGAVVIHGPTK